MGIFKAYDIRGVYPSEINEEIAYEVGRSIAKFLGVKQIVIGFDMRVSSESLSINLIGGLTDEGVNVVNIGLCSSPMIYFACNFLKAPASVMVTASHNPKEYNGFKLTREKAIPISGDTGIKEIEKIYDRHNFGEVISKGTVTEKDVSADYAKHILSSIDIDKIKPLKVVVDAGNGMGGVEVDLIKDKLPCEIIPLYFEPDGKFPNHEANPLKLKNMQDLIKKVKEEKADLGVALDGDSDRVFFTTEHGEIIPADFITALIAQNFLKSNKGEKILYDLRSSWIVKEKVEEAGGKITMCRVGHAFIKEQLREENAIFAGELSGHFYFRDNFYTDSGIIAMMKVIELLSDLDKPFSEIVKPLKKYFASGEINFKVEDKEGKMKELAEKYKDGTVSHLDGVRVDFKDWWFNVRASNTEPLLRLNLEAKSKELMEKKRDEVEFFIKGIA